MLSRSSVRSLSLLALASCASPGNWISMPGRTGAEPAAPWPMSIEKDPSPTPDGEISPERSSLAVAFLDYARGKDLIRAEPFLDRVAALGSDALPALRAGADDPDPELRFKSIVLLGEIGDPRSAEILASRLGDPSEEVAMMAARALRELGERWVGPRLFESFLGVTRHPSTKVRTEAAATAVELGFLQAVPFLLTIVKENTRLADPLGGWKDWEWSDRWAWQKWVASEALGKISGLETGFDANQGIPQMEESIRPWVEWWEKKGSFLKTLPALHHDARLQKMLATLKEIADSEDPAASAAAQRILEALPSL